MGPDKEIRQHAGAAAAAGAIALENLAGQKQGLSRECRRLNLRNAQYRLNLFQAQKTDREFSVDDVVNHDGATDGSSFQLSLRPIRPVRIIRDEVEQDIRIDQGHLTRPGSAP